MQFPEIIKDEEVNTYCKELLVAGYTGLLFFWWGNKTKPGLAFCESTGTMNVPIAALYTMQNNIWVKSSDSGEYTVDIKKIGSGGNTAFAIYSPLQVVEYHGLP